MKRFNLNDYILVQITDYGWNHLKKTVGEGYITHCILSYEQEVYGEKWYKLQMHQVMSLFGEAMGTSKSPINPNILLDI